MSGVTFITFILIRGGDIYMGVTGNTWWWPVTLPPSDNTRYTNRFWFDRISILNINPAQWYFF